MCSSDLHQDGEQGDDRCEHDRHGEHPVDPVVGSHGCYKESNAKERPDSLTEDEVIRIVELRQANDEARAIHRDEAGRRQDGRQRKKRVVGAPGGPLAGARCGYGDTSSAVKPGSAFTSRRKASPRTSKLG